MCNLVTCPEEYSYYQHGNKLSIFLAGGISGCKDWQKEMIDRFRSEDVTLINPRRTSFNIEKEEESEFQIKWEYRHLQKAHAVLFWFPYQTLCPITLYELGACAAKGKTIFVACHPAYQRAFDVKQQLELLRPGVKVHDNFGDMVDEIKEWIHTNTY